MDLQKIESKNNLIAFIRENTWTKSWTFKSEHGWGNGYVALPSTHPFYGLNYDEIDEHVNVADLEPLAEIYEQILEGLLAN